MLHSINEKQHLPTTCPSWTQRAPTSVTRMALLPVISVTLRTTSPILMGPSAGCISGWIINILPYARKETEAKNKTVYSRMTLREKVILVLGGALPLLWLPDPRLLWALLAPLSVFLFLVNLYKRKIDGYTGDCCGATCLLCELSFYLAAVVVLTVC